MLAQITELLAYCKAWSNQEGPPEEKTCVFHLESVVESWRVEGSVQTPAAVMVSPHHFPFSGIWKQ